MNVGVRELKQHLSQYLDRAASGEVIQVTERGVVKAQIVPVPGSGQMTKGVEEGWITPPSRSGGLPPVKRATSTRRSVEVLAEDRGE
jgi:prevent-host-death family protein